MPLLYSALAFFLTLGLLALELFIPSGGLLGIAAAASLICSIVLGFMHSLPAGAVVTVTSAVGIPIFITLGLKIWPRTAIGRMMLNIDPSATGDPLQSMRAEREQWIGKAGIALSDLLPSGLVEIDGRRLDAVSNGVAIDKGEAIEVCDYIAGRIQVKKPSLSLEPVKSFATVSPTTPSLLETPIDQLDASSDSLESDE